MRTCLWDGWSDRWCRRPQPHAGRRRSGWGPCGQSLSDTFIRRGSPVGAADWAYNRCRHAAIERFHIKSITLATAAFDFDRNHGWSLYGSFPDSDSSNQFPDDLAVDIGEAEVASGMAEGELFVVETEQG